MKSKITCIIISLALVMGMSVIAPKKAEAATMQQAVAWAESQVGKWRDYDGYYGAQCVDLFNFYVKEVFGINPYSYFGVEKAYQLANRGLPPDRRRSKTMPRSFPCRGTSRYGAALWAAPGMSPSSSRRTSTPSSRSTRTGSTPLRQAVRQHASRTTTTTSGA